jgi:hypothetical protein
MSKLNAATPSQESSGNPRRLLHQETARNPQGPDRVRIVWIASVALWLGVVAGGLGMVAAYDNRPGVSAQAVSRWPEASRLTPVADRPTLVMVVHPRCDCSRASVAELAELMARTTVPPRAYVVILKPQGLSEDWDATGIRHAATQIPGVKVVRDHGGGEARTFGAETSGQTFLYDARGRLLFSGGITAARGHMGESVGRTAILALLNKGVASNATSPVFGCSLSSPADQRWAQDVRRP